MNFAMAVILYQPEKNVLENIRSYINLTEKLYIIDNSNTQSLIIHQLQQYPQVNYLSMQGNKGIAAALNVGVHQALQDKIDYLITMDQDSQFTNDVFYGYIYTAESLFKKFSNAAVIGINYDGYSQKNPDQDIEVADEVITSGMIINLKIIKELGDFIEKLFIDYVDYEYCYRARKAGYLCLMVNKYKLNHQVGGMRPIVKYGIHFRNHNEHNAIRQYYMARNAIYVIKKYPEMAMKWVKNLIKAPIKIILVDDDKVSKSKGYIEGIIDGLRNHYGPKTYL